MMSFSRWVLLHKLAPAIPGLLAAFVGTTCAWGDVVRPPMQPSSTRKENFGQYLADHQAELNPFFAAHGGELVRQSIPFLLEMAGRILLLTFLVGWIFDVLLARGFAALFAATLANFRSALIYATGHLVIAMLITLLLSLAIMGVAGVTHLEAVLVMLGLLFVLTEAALQIGWIYYVYRTNLKIAGLFFLTLLVVHGFTILAIAFPLINAPADRSAKAFVEGKSTPELATEVAKQRAQLAAEAVIHRQQASSMAQLNDQIAAANDELIEVQKQIEAAKTSEEYLFSQIVKIHAHGDLPATRDQLTVFLTRFPNGLMAGLAKGQLTQVENELLAQDTQKKQAQANLIRSAAESRAALLARARRGQATLSDMRRALLGKTPREVSSLLGPPSEIASNRWGFGRQMIVNPLTAQKSGLAIYFSEGAVQGVDYYFGGAASP